MSEHISFKQHFVNSSPHCGQLLGAEAPPGGQRPDMDGPVPGAQRVGSPTGGPGPVVRAGMFSHRRCPPAAHLCQLCAGGYELLCRDPLHYRE